MGRIFDLSRAAAFVNILAEVYLRLARAECMGRREAEA